MITKVPGTWAHVGVLVSTLGLVHEIACCLFMVVEAVEGSHSCVIKSMVTMWDAPVQFIWTSYSLGKGHTGNSN